MKPTLADTSSLSSSTHDYLAERLDGARDLYLVALALGEREDDLPTTFGPMIREARIHFAAVIEETRAAGLTTATIAGMLGDSDLGSSIRPELWIRIQPLIEDGLRRRSPTGDHQRGALVPPVLV